MKGSAFMKKAVHDPPGTRVRPAGLAVTLLCLATVLLTPLGAAAADTFAVWGDFSNTLKIPPGVNPEVTKSTSATFFGGHISDFAQAPQGGGFKLVESSFGQMAANAVPFPGFQQAALDASLKMLYYDRADPAERDLAAFRYKVLLFGVDAGGKVSAQFQTMNDLWKAADRARALLAAQVVRDALKYDPSHLGLRYALLDIYYDTAVADMSKAKEKLVEAQKAALGLPGYLPPPGEFLITKEIELVDAAHALYDAAMAPYFALLKDPVGVDMARVDATAAAAGKPFGYYIFEHDVPARSLYAPSYKDADGNLQPVVPGDPLLFNGYKDLVLLFGMERDAARAAAKLARLYALRGKPGVGATPSDAELAQTVIGEAQQRSYTDGTILNGIFGASLDVPQSGLTEARASWGQGLGELSGVKGFLDGNSNPLGLDKGFLALVQTDIADQGSNDSYDYFEGLLLPDGEPAGPLGHAMEKYALAHEQYEAVKMYQDTIGAELQAQRSQFGDRLFAIAGAPFSKNPLPGDPYLTPENIPGSEIYIQLKNIEAAKLRILHNRQEIDNLYAQVANEIDRRGKEKGISDLIRQTYLIYGDKQATLTVAIGAIQAVQAAADAMTMGFGVFEAVSGKMGAAVANAAIQAAAEFAKATVQAKKEYLAAQEQARIQYQNDLISAANSEARVRDLWLGMHTLAIESQEAAVVLAQEVGRLKRLYDEKAYLEAQWMEAEEDLSTRYFADPSHRMILDRRIIESDFAFDQAQLWVFMMARALEYKWNTSVVAPGSTDGRTYAAGTVFALRNAQELVEMAEALYNWNASRPIGIRGGDQFVKFSLREDFLGFKRFDFKGNPLLYPDPLTGVSVDALTAFRSYLKSVAPHRAPSNSGLNMYREVVRLEFGTAKPNFNGTFFSPGRWNEKIRWLSVQINADDQNLPDLIVWLEQSGLGFVRNQIPGQPYPDHPDLVKDEWTSYPTRYWYQADDILPPHQLRWYSKDTFGFVINAAVAKDPDVPVESLRKQEFHEMPPAVSKWVLEIPLVHDSGQPVIDLNRVNDVEIWFMNYYKTRN